MYIFNTTMAFSLNQIMLVGNITDEFELRQTNSGKSVTDINLQVKTRFQRRDNNEWQVGTSYHTVVLWGRQAEIVDQFLKPGSQVFISGRLKTEEWEGENGQKRRKTKVIARELILLDSKSELPQLAELSPVAGGINKACVIGNMSRDPELRQTPSGEEVCNFGVATNMRWQQDNGDTQEETEFHNVVVWGETAKEIADKIKKGQKVLVQGPCTTRSWETPDGEKRFTTEINADEVILLGYNTGGNFSAGASRSEQKDTINISDDLPDIPEISHESDIKPEDLPF